jgi:Kef-type K+ transport system membrane component KefB
MGKLAEKTGLPNITGYIITGLLIGNSITGIVDTEMEHSLHLITELALSIIAITIGGEFLLSKLKKLGKGIIVLTLFEQLGALTMVTGVLYLLGLPLPIALLMGATEPAATVAIVNSLKAKGKFIDYLYGIVALDDAGAVILYGILFAVATVIMDTTGTSGLTALINILKAFFSIIASVFLGLASGWLLYQFVKKLYSSGVRPLHRLQLEFLPLWGFHLFLPILPAERY